MREGEAGGSGTCRQAGARAPPGFLLPCLDLGVLGTQQPFLLALVGWGRGWEEVLRCVVVLVGGEVPSPSIMTHAFQVTTYTSQAKPSETFITERRTGKFFRPFLKPSLSALTSTAVSRGLRQLGTTRSRKRMRPP